jgi:DNA-directed RNA polymerase subunit RPC12/RpoP
MKKAKCPSCKNTVEIQEETKVKDLITCPHCHSILELIKIFPPTLDWAEDPAIASRHLFTRMY